MCRKSQRKCLFCRDHFQPDHRNKRRQHYCTKPECRRASKTASQKRWLNKSKNQDYFKSPLHVQRVQAWRKAHPGYWRKKGALQDICDSEQSENKEESTHKTSPIAQDSLPLQDFLIMQYPVFVGLISMLTGSTLQDDIANITNRFVQLGLDIQSGKSNFNGGKNADQKNHLSRPVTPSTGTVQLGRPPPSQG